MTGEKKADAIQAAANQANKALKDYKQAVAVLCAKHNKLPGMVRAVVERNEFIDYPEWLIDEVSLMHKEYKSKLALIATKNGIKNKNFLHELVEGKF